MSWSAAEKAIIVEAILLPNGFFDHAVAMWFARAEVSEDQIHVENALTSDDALRIGIATEVVNERRVVGGNFGKNKASIVERHVDYLMLHLMEDLLAKLSTLAQ